MSWEAMYTGRKRGAAWESMRFLLNEGIPDETKHTVPKNKHFLTMGPWTVHGK
jgi:hypothetical protein